MERIKRNPRVDNDTVVSLVNTYLKAREEVKVAISQYRSEITVNVDRSGRPFKIVHAGDTHFGHDHSNPDGLPEAIRESEGSILALHGNIIDSVSPKFISTNTIKVTLDLDEQTNVVSRLLADKDRNRQVIPITGHRCHEGWSVKNATHDPAKDIVSRDTPILWQGGQIVFTRNGVRLGSVELYHNPGGGATKQSPEGALRRRYRETPADDPDRPTTLVSGHTHQLVAGQDCVHVPNDGDTITSYGITGTSKGTKEKPDTFLISLGVPPRNQPADAGSGLVTIWEQSGNTKNKLDCYPVAGYQRARILFDAKTLYFDISKNDAEEDLQNQIERSGRFKQPETRLDKRQSRERGKDSASVSEGKNPIYKRLQYEIDSNLPMIFHFIGNTRFGSTTLMRKPLEKIMDEINDNPWAFFTLTRRLINTDIPDRTDRKEVLDAMAAFFGRGRRRPLGIMITDTLTEKKWVKDIKSGSKNDMEVSKGFYPGDYLFRETDLEGTPLIAPESEMVIKTKDVKYSLMLRDKLSHFTSLINPDHGLTRIQEIWGSRSDAFIGGHTEVVGWRTWMRSWGQLECVIPGGYSEYIEKGVGNRVDYPLGGQGLILFPDRKLLYSFADAGQGEEMHHALWFYSALDQLGILDRTKDKLKPKSR